MNLFFLNFVWVYVCGTPKITRQNTQHRHTCAAAELKWMIHSIIVFYFLYGNNWGRVTLERKFPIKIFTQIDRSCRWYFILLGNVYDEIYMYTIFRHMNECHFSLLHSIYIEEIHFFFLFVAFSLCHVIIIWKPYCLFSLHSFLFLYSQFVTRIYSYIHVQQLIEPHLAEKFILYFPATFSFSIFNSRHGGISIVGISFFFYYFWNWNDVTSNFSFPFQFPAFSPCSSGQSPPPHTKTKWANIIFLALMIKSEY